MASSIHVIRVMQLALFARGSILFNGVAGLHVS